ncbi:MAG: CBS domain-containing protein [Kistimonas sp.]|nr:CBS domain-containing protein [Kistimonas sp.]
MSDDSSGSGLPARTWLEKLKQVFSDHPLTRDEFLDQLRDAEHNDLFDREALNIIEGALQVADMQVREVMVPRAQMVCVQADQSPEAFLPAVINSAHSRFPVIGASKDEILGVLLAKDLLHLLLKKDRSQFSIRKHLRPARVIPESKRLNVLLNDFRSNRSHMAIVIDEYGGVAGLVTIEDVLEQIVGDIEDEYDVEDDSFIKSLGDDEFVVKALTPVDEFNSSFRTHFSERDFDTIGGVVMQQFGRLPRRGETLEREALRFQILNADSRRIRLLRVTRCAPQPASRMARPEEGRGRG